MKRLSVSVLLRALEANGISPKAVKKMVRTAQAQRKVVKLDRANIRRMEMLLSRFGKAAAYVTKKKGSILFVEPQQYKKWSFKTRQENGFGKNGGKIIAPMREPEEAVA